MPNLKRRWRGRAVALAVGVAAGGILGYLATRANPSYALPNASTPGAILTSNPSLICVSGYTATVRVNLTVVEERQVDHAYGWTYGPGKQEYDHLIPLELGGDNGLVNIWPEPIAQAHVKDRLENALHARACQQHTVAAIQSAQACIRADWVACWKKAGSP